MRVPRNIKSAYPSLLNIKTATRRRQHPRTIVVDGKLVSVYSPRAAQFRRIKARQSARNFLGNLSYGVNAQPEQLVLAMLEYADSPHAVKALATMLDRELDRG